MIKVVQLVPAMEQGGVEQVVLTLNRLLSHAGIRSIVLSSGGRLVPEIVRDGGVHCTIDLKSKNPLSAPLRVLKLQRMLRKIVEDDASMPSLVCAHSRVPAWLFVMANRKLKLPWITYAHGANSVSRYSEVMTRGALTIVPSKFLADYLTRNYNLPDGCLRVIPNAIDLTRFDPEKLDQHFIENKRKEWGIVDGEKVLMSVGRITPIKGLETVIRNLQPNERLIIVGGVDKSHQAYFGRLKAISDSRVVFAGVQDKVPECLSLADVVVSGNATKPETFGLSIAEAYAMNKPVVAKRFGGAAEVMADIAAEIADGRAVDYRDAVRNLYGTDKLLAKTLAAYREVLNG